MLKIGDAAEMTEAEGPYQRTPSIFYPHVPNVDRGSICGDRTASVKDAFGNMWYIATHIRDVMP